MGAARWMDMSKVSHGLVEADNRDKLAKTLDEHRGITEVEIPGINEFRAKLGNALSQNFMSHQLADNFMAEAKALGLMTSR